MIKNLDTEIVDAYKKDYDYVSRGWRIRNAYEMLQQLNADELTRVIHLIVGDYSFLRVDLLKELEPETPPPDKR